MGGVSGGGGGPRSRGYVQQFSVCVLSRALCRHTRGRFERTHVDISLCCSRHKDIAYLHRLVVTLTYRGRSLLFLVFNTTTR